MSKISETCLDCGQSETSILIDKSCPLAARLTISVIRELVGETMSGPTDPEPLEFPLDDGTSLSFPKREIESRFDNASALLDAQVELCVEKRTAFDMINSCEPVSTEFEPLVSYTPDEIVRLLDVAGVALRN